jgi:hypothetical protein
VPRLPSRPTPKASGIATAALAPLPVERSGEEENNNTSETGSASGAGGTVAATMVLGEKGEFKLAGRVAGRLYEHQLKGVRWLWSLHSMQKGGILGDDMGEALVASLRYDKLTPHTFLPLPSKHQSVFPPCLLAAELSSFTPQQRTAISPSIGGFLGLLLGGLFVVTCKSWSTLPIGYPARLYFNYLEKVVTERGRICDPLGIMTFTLQVLARPCSVQPS